MVVFGDLILVILIIAIIVGVGFGFPYFVDDHFQKNYGERVLSKGYAVVQAICLFLLYVDATSPDSPWLLFSLGATLLSFTLGIRACLSNARSQGADRRDLPLVITAQIALSLGIVLVIFYVLFSSSIENQKKRRRR